MPKVLPIAHFLGAATILFLLGTDGSLAQQETHKLADRAIRDFDVFVSAAYTGVSGHFPAVRDSDDFTPTADLFYAHDAEKIRVLAEYLVTDDENELERLQLGWQASETTRLWLGRFHQPASYWNTEHHHGQYLQTSIYRPAIEEFEDNGGVLPSHTTGLLLEHLREVGARAGLQLSFSAGLTGVLIPGVLEPFDLLDPESGHGRSASLRLTFLPEFLGENQIGFTYGHHELNIESGVDLPATWGPDTHRIDLTTMGVVADWRLGKWRLTAAGTGVETSPCCTGVSSDSSFVASYLQIEYPVSDQLTAYGRADRTNGWADYLDLFPMFVDRESLLGVNWALRPKQTLKLELASSHSGMSDFRRYSIEWSTLLP